MERWCWVKFPVSGRLLILIIVRHGPSALAVGEDGVCLDILALVCHFSLLPPSP